MSLYVAVTYEKNQFGTLGCFSCLAVLNKAVLPEDSTFLMRIFVFLYAVELLGHMVDISLALVDTATFPSGFTTF